MFSLGLGNVGGRERAVNFDSGANSFAKIGETDGETDAELTGDTSLWSMAAALSGDKDLALFFVSPERSKVTFLENLAHGDGGDGGAVADLLLNSSSTIRFESSVSKSLNDLFLDRNFVVKSGFVSDLAVMEALNWVNNSL